MKALKNWLARRQRMKGPVLPGARFVRPEGWTETDKENFERFLKTPSGAKLLLTLHALVTDRALTVQECSSHDYGVTAGMSRLLGEIENMAVDGEGEPDGENGAE